MLLLALLALPLVTGLLCRWLYRRQRLIEWISCAGALTTAALALAVAIRVARDGAFDAARGVLYVDALAAILIGTIGAVGAAAACVSIGYMRRELSDQHVPEGRRGLGWYYLGLHVFVWTMLATVSVDNVGLLWVGIEATTLASALLVGFYRTPAAIEAAWKYVIICTVGITFALFGVLLTYYASLQTGSSTGLDWTSLSAIAPQLDPAMMRLAFVFVLIGFGTKAGFAPLHTWLADAHSQAPSPISGLLSGVLLACALYGLVRFHALTALATGDNFSANLLMAFGILSVAVAAPFILVQRDLKRLLAYSSVEHIGLMAIAFGVGGTLGVFAGVLHLINHAATKALLFFAAGDIVQRYGARRISALQGALRAAPVAGWLLFLGALAIAGAPPSGIFISELSILWAAFEGSRMEVVVGVLTVTLLAIAFAGILAHILRVAYGNPSPTQTASLRAHAGGRDLTLIVPLVVLGLVVVTLGLFVPEPLRELINEVYVSLAPATQSAGQ